MKKSLLALAVLGAFAGAASAQSSVTIYGKIDLGIVKADEAAAGSATLAGAPSTDEFSLQQNARSRLGFRGTEDLGGGLKANFNIEHSLVPDTGVAADPFWSQSWLGLSGGFGEVRLGRDYTPSFYVALAGDPFGFDTVAQAGAVHTLAGVGATRNNNQISYKTPNFSGFTAMVAFAPSEGTVAGGADENAYGANVMYSAGALTAGFGYQRGGNQSTYVVTPAVGTTPAVTAADSTLYVLTASYNLNFVRPIVQYSQGTADNAAGAEVADFSNWLIGATAPLGGGELKAVYTVRENNNTNVELSKFGIGYHYPLSKRTKVYADLGSADQDGLQRRTAVDIGVQHNF